MADIEVNMKRLEEMVDEFVSICLEVFGPQRVEAIIQHGSSVKGGAIPGYSDIDLQVYLTPDCFDQEHRLLDDLCFAFQDRFGPLPWQETGFNYGQVYFYDRHALPDWWTGPPRDTYSCLVGKLPAEAEALMTGCAWPLCAC
jgi:predicted nucleotidyltransferase